MSNVDFYEIRTVYVKNASDFLRVVSNPKVVDYHMSRWSITSINGFTGECTELRQVILVLEA